MWPVMQSILLYAADSGTVWALNRHWLGWPGGKVATMALPRVLITPNDFNLAGRSHRRNWILAGHCTKTCLSFRECLRWVCLSYCDARE